jgi:NitT/TauT family transport system ATP-binding protein
LKRPTARYLERACRLIELVGLSGFENKKPHQLSGGMRQRVAICRTLVYDPDILLMDEPFSALDAMTRDEMNVLLLDIWQKQKKTALFVTHSIREAVFLGDRVLVMTHRPGTVVEDLRIPFPRPRSLAIGETRQFNEICAHLRTLIGSNLGNARQPDGAVAAPSGRRV